MSDVWLRLWIGCATCHRPTLRTGKSALPALRNQAVAAYTDLRLHDMGAALSDAWDADGIPGSAFRTPPLWGLRNSGPPYLHDGRAASVRDAIELHGGEAAGTVDAYRRLSPPDKTALDDFVKSL